MRCLAIFSFQKGPHLFDWIELAALRGKELGGEVITHKELIQLLGMMDS